MAERPTDVLNNQNEEVSEVEEVRLQPILSYKVFRAGGSFLCTLALQRSNTGTAFSSSFFSFSPPTHTLCERICLSSLS